MTTPKVDPKFPNRPQHPDFWALAQAVQSLDGYADSGMSFEEVVATAKLDYDSLYYMAQQRSLRAEKLFTHSPAPLSAKLTAQWIDGFMAGLMVGDGRSMVESEAVLAGELDDGNRRQGEKP